MLSSIHPFGERARNQRYGTTTVAFIVGSSFGGLVLGAGAALLSTASRAVGVVTYLPMIVLVTAAAWELLGLPVPSLRRQVDENWLARYRGWVYGIGFGFQLGVGFSTYVKSALTYGFVLAAVLFGSAQLALVSGVIFGLVRGMSILLTSRVGSPRDLRALFSRMGKTQSWVRVGGAVGVALLALTGIGGVS